MKKLTLVLFSLLFFGLPLRNHAQNPTFPEEEYQPKSPALSGALSVGLTIIPAVAGGILLHNNHDLLGGILLGSGLLTGPASGYIYAGKASSSWLGIGLRAGGTAISYTGAAIIVADVFSGNWLSEEDDSTSGTEIAGTILFFSGAGLFLYATIRDWIRSVRITREENQKHATVQLFPNIDHHTGQPMLGLNVNF